MNKIASTTGKAALHRASILNISKNVQAPITPTPPPDSSLPQKNEFKISLHITKGNINGQYLRSRSFSTFHPKRNFSKANKTNQKDCKIFWEQTSASFFF